MRKIESVAETVGAFILIGLIFEFGVPGFNGIFTGLLKNVFWPIFKAFFMQDLVINIVVFLIIAAVFAGGIQMSRKQENIIWGIASSITALISAVLMLWK